jgi:hypothetical protein
MYIGQGDYTSLVPETSNITFTSDTDGVFMVQNLGLGTVYNNGTAYIVDLANEYSPSTKVVTAQFQLNFQGIGLPHYAYDRVVSLLFKSGFENQ